jgi:hypothetical protein
MPRLILNDRTFEDDDGIWTRLEFIYGHPWENGNKPDVTVLVKTFCRKEGKGLCLGGEPDDTKLFVLSEMEVTMLWGFLAAAKEIMPRQWAEYLVGETPEEKALRGAGASPDATCT